MSQVRERCYGLKFGVRRLDPRPLRFLQARYQVSNITIHRWVIRCVPEFEKRWNRMQQHNEVIAGTRKPARVTKVDVRKEDSNP